MWVRIWKDVEWRTDGAQCFFFTKSRPYKMKDMFNFLFSSLSLITLICCASFPASSPVNTELFSFSSHPTFYYLLNIQLLFRLCHLPLHLITHLFVFCQLSSFLSVSNFFFANLFLCTFSFHQQVFLSCLLCPDDTRNTSQPVSLITVAVVTAVLNDHPDLVSTCPWRPHSNVNFFWCSGLSSFHARKNPAPRGDKVTDETSNKRVLNAVVHSLFLWLGELIKLTGKERSVWWEVGHAIVGYVPEQKECEVKGGWGTVCCPGDCWIQWLGL